MEKRKLVEKIHKKWQTTEINHIIVKKKLTKSQKLTKKGYRLVNKSEKESQTSEIKSQNVIN